MLSLAIVGDHKPVRLEMRSRVRRLDGKWLPLAVVDHLAEAKLGALRENRAAYCFVKVKNVVFGFDEGDP